MIEDGATEGLVNLAGGDSRVIFATDEWFACADNLLQRGPPSFDPAAFCAQGKVMDGWESRRRRLAGHDWCVIRLGLPGAVVGFEVDTSFFTGNQAPTVSIEVAYLPDVGADDAWMPGAVERALTGCVRGTSRSPEQIADAAAATAAAGPWYEALKPSALRPGIGKDGVHWFAAAPGAMDADKRATHVRLNYFPDGGVARLRVWGNVVVDYPELASRGIVNLAALTNGARGVGCSNAHYGTPQALLQAGRGLNMGDGWETARHPHRPGIVDVDPETGLQRSDLSDWAVVRLGAVARSVERLVIDTHHFKGNYPESALVEGIYAPCDHRGLADGSVADASVDGVDQRQWFTLLSRTRLCADTQHVAVRGCDSGDASALQLEAASAGRPLSHVRITIFPDGGIMRLRVHGQAAEPLL